MDFTNYRLAKVNSLMKIYVVELKKDELFQPLFRHLKIS